MIPKSNPPDSGRWINQTFFDLDLRADGIVWLRRTSKPYARLEEVNLAYDQFLPVVDRWLEERSPTSDVLAKGRRPLLGWLYDVRQAPAQRDDPEFEGVIRARRRDLLRRSPFIVVLVKTAVGRLQVHRIASGDQIRVLDDPEEAVASLRRDLSALPNRRKP